jgi:hypothetical protein
VAQETQVAQEWLGSQESLAAQEWLAAGLRQAAQEKQPWREKRTCHPILGWHRGHTMVTPDPFPLSRALLEAVLEDRVSDRFVCELVWCRLGYLPAREPPEDGPTPQWRTGPDTPSPWAEGFPEAPEVIAERAASVALTRSVPAGHKQLLKQQLGFGGYRIGELYPRRTRRATAVNWLLAHLAEQGVSLPETGPLPPLREPPGDPRFGHPGDPPVG